MKQKVKTEYVKSKYPEELTILIDEFCEDKGTAIISVNIIKEIDIYVGFISYWKDYD